LKPCLLRNDNLVDILSLVRQDANPDELKEAFREASMLREPYWKGENGSYDQLHVMVNNNVKDNT